mmetsp:Transcript_3409/g.7986  ORF Transcript_3409/g.7986 Transcript_3409/m.7986 type:complete len:310 (-) Transcript_3409:156-1085(-)
MPKTCSVCGSDTKLRCGACKQVFYCSRKHQVQDWKFHKTRCVAIAKKKNPPVDEKEMKIRVNQVLATITKFDEGVRKMICDYYSNIIEVKSMDELCAALKRVSSLKDRRFTISVAEGPYVSSTALEIPADYIRKFEGVGMDRQGSTILDMPVKVVASTQVPRDKRASSFEFELIGLRVLKQLRIETKDCIPRMKIERVHSTTPSSGSHSEDDAMVIESARKVLMNDCEVHGGADGLEIIDADVHIKSSEIRFAASRGIFASSHFTVEDVEISNCGGYGMKTRMGVTRIGDNDIQPGPWDNHPGYGGLFM